MSTTGLTPEEAQQWGYPAMALCTDLDRSVAELIHASAKDAFIFSTGTSDSVVRLDSTDESNDRLSPPSPASEGVEGHGPTRSSTRRLDVVLAMSLDSTALYVESGDLLLFVHPTLFLTFRGLPRRLSLTESFGEVIDSALTQDLGLSRDDREAADRCTLPLDVNVSGGYFKTWQGHIIHHESNGMSSAIQTHLRLDPNPVEGTVRLFFTDTSGGLGSLERAITRTFAADLRRDPFALTFHTSSTRSRYMRGSRLYEGSGHYQAIEDQPTFRRPCTVRLTYRWSTRGPPHAEKGLLSAVMCRSSDLSALASQTFVDNRGDVVEASSPCVYLDPSADTTAGRCVGSQLLRGTISAVPLQLLGDGWEDLQETTETRNIPLVVTIEAGIAIPATRQSTSRDIWPWEELRQWKGRPG
jgi:hypothetical protein